MDRILNEKHHSMIHHHLPHPPKDHETKTDDSSHDLMIDPLPSSKGGLPPLPIYLSLCCELVPKDFHYLTLLVPYSHFHS